MEKVRGLSYSGKKRDEQRGGEKRAVREGTALKEGWCQRSV